MSSTTVTPIRSLEGIFAVAGGSTYTREGSHENEAHKRARKGEEERRVCVYADLQDKLVDTNRDGSDQDGVQHLIILLTLRGSNIHNLPLKVYIFKKQKTECQHRRNAERKRIEGKKKQTSLEFPNTLKGDLKLEGIGEGRRVIQDLHVRDVHQGHVCEWFD